MRRVVWVVAITMVVLLVAAVTTAIAWPALWQTIWSFLYDYRWWWALAAVVAAAVLPLWQVGKLLQRPWGAPWRAHVLATADALKYQLDALPAGATPAERELRDSVSQAVQHHLGVARKAAWPKDDERLPVGEQFLDWWTGAPIEAAYVNLHEAEIALAQLLPNDQIQAQIPEALARLQTMEVTDPRRRAAETQLASNSSGNQRRAAFHSAVRIGLELKDQQHDRLRGFRNVVLTTAAGLMVLVVALCVVGAWKPDALPLCFGPPPTTAAPGQPPPPIQGPAGVACPSEEAPPTPGTHPRRLPAPGDVTLVALLGLLGGGLSTALAIRGLQGTSTPYDVPVALSLLKLPSGALTALVGLVFIRGEFVPGLSQLDNQPQILAYAFLFGISQQLFTRLVDQQAQDILGKMPSKEPISAKPEPSPAEPPTEALGQPERPRRLPRRPGRQRA
jgi:amino acid transporter